MVALSKCVRQATDRYPRYGAVDNVEEKVCCRKGLVEIFDVSLVRGNGQSVKERSSLLRKRLVPWIVCDKAYLCLFTCGREFGAY